MRTTVAGSVRKRLAMARTLRRTYSRGCSRMGRMISWRFALRGSMRSGRLIAAIWVWAGVFFMRRENCPKPFACQRRPRRLDKELSKKCRLFLGSGCLGGQSGSDDGLEEGHHGAKLGAQLFDGMGLLAVPGGQKIGAALFVFFDPFFGEAAVADFRENFAHFFAGLLGDDS